MGKAIATLSGDSPVTGTVVLTQDASDQPTMVSATFTNLPAGLHGFHIHEFGDLSNGCTSAGSHFNPFNKKHGGPLSSERHVGDMGNVVSAGEKTTRFSITDSSIALTGPHSVIGRSVVIHADEDDLGMGNYQDSPTTGHSGARLACGVIGLTSS